MQVHTAQLAGGANNADRVFVLNHAVIVLDGASAFEPVDVDPATYADALGRALADRLAQQPEAGLSEVVADGIYRTARHLWLSPGRSPSSTVSILRVRDHIVDLYALGDSPIYYGTDSATHRLLDERLASVAEEEREQYVSQLRAGQGYGTEHHAALATLQRTQARHRNDDAGYWIAEARPSAAHHALSRSLSTEEIEWAVLATDGAADLIDHLDYDWPTIASYNTRQLGELLDRINAWETETDPHGRDLPRAKRHDDKTIAAVRNTE